MNGVAGVVHAESVSCATGLVCITVCHWFHVYRVQCVTLISINIGKVWKVKVFRKTITQFKSGTSCKATRHLALHHMHISSIVCKSSRISLHLHAADIVYTSSHTWALLISSAQYLLSYIQRSPSIVGYQTSSTACSLLVPFPVTARLLLAHHQCRRHNICYGALAGMYTIDDSLWSLNVDQIATGISVGGGTLTGLEKGFIQRMYIGKRAFEIIDFWVSWVV